MIFRLFHKPCIKIRAGSLTDMSLDENSYANWSAHLFTADRMQYIILTTRSRPTRR